MTVESCDHREQEVRKWLQERIDAEQKKLERLAEKIIKAMASFKEEFKLETSEIARILGKTHGNVRVLLHRATEALRDLVSTDDHPHEAPDRGTTESAEA